MADHQFTDFADFSKLFVDFVNKQESIYSRFTGNNKTPTILFEEILSSYKNREDLIRIIENSQIRLELNKNQQTNLQQLYKDNTLCIVAGQQVGFLGGPVYAMYKISSVINMCKKYSDLYPEYNFVPLLWIEDNDHDLREPSSTFLMNKEFQIEQLKSIYQTDERFICASQVYGYNIYENVNSIYELLPNTQYTRNITDLLHSVYTPGKSWTNAYIDLMNNFFAQDGLLYLSESKARADGVFDGMSSYELSNISETEEIISKSNKLLEEAGYYIHSKSSPINLFMHYRDRRFKLNYNPEDKTILVQGNEFSIDELLEYHENEIGMFSPNVMLRHLYQNTLIPTAVFVASPSEIGYLAQLKELYEFHDQIMPMVIQRHSATFLNKWVIKHLDRQGLDAIYFNRKYHLIEADLLHEVKEESNSILFANMISELNRIYDLAGKELNKIDPNLERSINSAFSKNINIISNLEKKTESATKRRYNERFETYKYLSNYIYPFGSLQERIFSPINFINECGIERFKKLIFDLVAKEPDRHYRINLI